ncbi:MAG: LysM peptidoglycan-binding domain-containing protein [Pseudomonadota bacterium]|nr:LysM peptidoglycan-binding domain-containing protein [Pseudomonadota bacterium]
MQKQAFFKIALAAASLLVVASCSSTPDKSAETSASPSIHSAKIKKHRHTPWQEAYDEAPESDTENTLSASDLQDPDPNLPVTDVWQRIRTGFQISDYRTLHPETERHLRWFIDHPQYVDRVVERARPYLYHIVEEVKKRNMPMEAALLPVVESGFKPHAYSRSHAAGLWQFIPGTGKVYGLEQNWWYDGRRDVIRSTTAALDYLQKLHNDFGDWQLAFAAYNCGEGTVGRAIKRNQELGKPTDFWSLDLPSETSAYVPKLMAVSHMVKFPARYDISLSPIDNEPYIGIVDIGSQIDLAVAAEMAGLSEDELNHLNPAFNRWATAPDGPHQLVLPLDRIDGFKLALAKMPASKRVKWARHKIQRGESLSVIARRYNTTVSVIKQANQLSNNQIRAGSHLLIPVASGQLSSTALAHAGQSDADSPEQQKQLYTVKSGDTWWDIARKHELDVATLATWNKKTAHDILKPGQQLVIWTQAAKRKSVNYTIKNGDSLWAISRKFNVSVADVREWNGLSDRTMLQPGQNLRLYLDET